MSAYVIVDIEVTDAEQYEEYKRRVPESIKAFGGRYLVRGGAIETLEGSWSPQRIVLLQFDSIEQARAWRQSPQYQDIHRMRNANARSNMVVVEGFSAHNEA
jgi:uncharacterized protein (DUF1330 family)